MSTASGKVQQPIRRKIVCVGDGACGKTSLLLVYGKGEFPSSYVPTVFENFITNIELDSVSIELAVWDTAGQEEYDRLRPLSYPNTHVIIICFSLDSPASLSNIGAKWAPEVKHFCPNVPVVLVCCKTDLRGDIEAERDLALNSLGKMPTTEEGEEVARQIQAIQYLECSALKNEGVKEVFDTATRASLTVGKKSRKGCILL